MDKPPREAVRRLQEVGNEDLASARLLLGADPPLARVAAFHSQQAAETHPKAWLVALGEPEPPALHSLPALARLIAGRGGPVLDGAPLWFLSRFAVAPRYGLAHPTLADAQRALAEAERTVEDATRAVTALMASSAPE